MEARIYVRIYSDVNGGVQYEANLDGEIATLDILINTLDDKNDVTKLIKKIVQIAAQ